MVKEKAKPARKRIGPSQFSAKKLGAAIQAIREGCGLNQSQFAKLIGLTRQGVAVLENGSVELTVSTLDKVAQVAGRTIPEVVALGLLSSEPEDVHVLAAMREIRQLEPKSLKLGIPILRILKQHAGKYLCCEDLY